LIQRPTSAPGRDKTRWQKGLVAQMAFRERFFNNYLDP
jgi:hypothetical protein